jgi:hypothetical protein
MLPNGDVSDTSVSEDKAEVVPKGDYDALAQELQAWKEQIGDAYKLSPAETRQILDSVSQQLNDKKAADLDAPPPKGKLSPEKLEAARTFLEEAFPGLTSLPDVVKALRGETIKLAERGVMEDRKKAEGIIAGLAKEEGYISDAKKDAGFLRRLYHLVGNEVGDDPKLMSAYLKGDVEVVQAAFDAVKKDLEPKVIKVKKEPVRFPSMLTRHGGLSLGAVQEDADAPTPEQLAKMSPRERTKSTHDRAWALMQRISAANEAERQLFGGS